MGEHKLQTKIENDVCFRAFVEMDSVGHVLLHVYRMLLMLIR